MKKYFIIPILTVSLFSFFPVYATNPLIFILVKLHQEQQVEQSEQAHASIPQEDYSTEIPLMEPATNPFHSTLA